MKVLFGITMGIVLLLSACNESRRGNDSNVNETRNEAAAESNTDKFEGKTQRDAEFVYEVIESNYEKIKLAELANQRSRNSEVKQIAQTLLNDLPASLNELKTLAQSKAISIPVKERPSTERKLDNLADKSGYEFNKRWCDEMMDLHEETVEKFEKRLEDTNDADLKAYISKTLPVLRKHHESLEACEERLRKDS